MCSYRLGASDPAATRSPLPPAEANAIRVAILATLRTSPRPPRVARSHRRRAALALAAVAAVVATAGAATATSVDWDAVLPGVLADGSQVVAPPIDREGMRQEAQRVESALADPPGYTTPPYDPGAAPDVGGGEFGAGASTALARKQCTWQRALLDAHAAGDTAAEERARDELRRDLLYRYVAGGGAEQRAINTDPARLADLQQVSDVNCPGGAYDRNVHPEAPPIDEEASARRAQHAAEADVAHAGVDGLRPAGGGAVARGSTSRRRGTSRP